MPSATKYIIHILLLVLASANQNTQQQYLDLLQSSSFTTTSFILPISYKHNQWIISSSFSQCAQPQLFENSNEFISLSIFFNQLSLQQHHKNINIQLHIISATTNIKEIINLSKIIHSLPTTVSITNIIIPNSLISQSNIFELITSYNIPIATYIHSSLSIPAHRHLLVNTTTTQVIIKSWVCKPWPIYISFFSGIGVTVIISLAIKFSMGEHDDDLHRALEKVVHAGIGTGANNENGNQIDEDLSVLKIHPPTRTTSYKNAMATVTPLHTPVVHSKKGRTITEISLAGHIKNISLDDFGRFNITPRHHNRKVTFADEKKEKLIKDGNNDSNKHVRFHEKSENKPKYSIATGLNLPNIATTLFNIPSAASVNVGTDHAHFVSATSASKSSSSDELKDNKEEISELSAQVGIEPLRPQMSVQSNSATEHSRREMNTNGNDIELNDVDEFIDIGDLVHNVNDNIDRDEDPCIRSDSEIP